MQELEKIAKELGDWIEYSYEDNIEILAYKDRKSKIAAVKTPDYQGVRCDVGKEFLNSYLEQLKSFDNPLAKRIYESLSSNSRNMPDISKNSDSAQTLIGDYFELSDFVDLPELMKMHKEFSDD